jgi:hypothetical protein
MNNNKTKYPPYIFISGIAAGVFAAITIIIALGGIAATVFVPEGIAAFFLAVLASLLGFVAALAGILAVAIIAIFTKSSQLRVYSIAFCALFLVVTLVINATAYGWFFLDPEERTEYEAEMVAYDDGIGHLFHDQLNEQRETGSMSSGYFEWRMSSNWGYEYYNIEGTKNGVPIYISASNYGDETWDIYISTDTFIPDVKRDGDYVYSDEWRISDGRARYKELYSDEWVDLAGREPYFENENRIRAINELITDERVDFLLAGALPSVTYDMDEENLGAAAEHKRLSRYIELLTELYPPEGTWDPALCTPYA